MRNDCKVDSMREKEKEKKNEETQAKIFTLLYI